MDPAVELRETHTGIVILCGNRVYKVKKSITTDFLDFATPQQRQRACAREIELNRRLAPDIYLGLGHFTQPDEAPYEPVIVMRRLPEHTRLSHRLSEPAGEPVDLTALIDVLVDFHTTARRGPEIDRAGTADGLWGRWTDLLTSMRHQPPEILDPALLDTIHTLARQYLTGRQRLFEDRIATGRIIDGHGDLLAEDIFELPDGFRILDCLDFDDDLRFVDCLDDIAFLAMDLQFLGHPEHAANLIHTYQRRTADTAPASLADHYIAYRALVRAKVDAIRAGQGDTEGGDRAHRHLQIAVEHLRASTVRLVLVGGLPGTGKSSLAVGLAEHTDAAVLSSDTIRAELRAAGEIVGESGIYGHGAYSPENKQRVYTELLNRARTLLDSGRSVILDASWGDATERRRAHTLARRTGARFAALRCVCPAPVTAERIRRRRNDTSEATPRIAATLADAADPWPEATDIDTGNPPDTAVSTACLVWDALADATDRSEPAQPPGSPPAQPPHSSGVARTGSAAESWARHLFSRTGRGPA
ncbi:bifunctional aminoglycoside phosphotransferase/ATP-binding protein [Nocardia flavorosea]|uniref:AAA family ATPase n=1 Tax=Nocardia flavorosea TaxID=53429 RepID=A0A846YKB8_9NOCA|nr:bifunctional aminoglycoside phosphotransferase/ATP-binding protein [Nocardia flavorosea]NKY59375.1 AAA family ATPase [Nocardia flavorosea]